MTPSGRLAAILAVDVAGYSRLMGEDEAGAGSEGTSGGGEADRCGAWWAHCEDHGRRGSAGVSLRGSGGRMRDEFPKFLATQRARRQANALSDRRQRTCTN